jgi:hypothetical protein
MKTLIKIYQDLQESGSTSDFPYILANTMYKVLLEKFKGVNSPWRQYTMQGDLNDFRTADRVLVDEAPDLEEVLEDGIYKDSKMTDYRYQIYLRTFGRTFSIGRRVVVNDDLNVIKKTPQRLGRAAGRTLVKRIVGMIEGDGNTYDNKNLFHADHGNSGNTTLANTITGRAAVSAAMSTIEKATDESGEKMGLTAKYLLVPIDLEDIALQIKNSREVRQISTSGGGTSPGGKVARLTVLVEPFLTSTTAWYVMSDPEDCPIVEVGFLNGKEAPDLLALKPEAVNLAGGDDPWGYEFDDLNYKVRHDYGYARAMYQGIYRGKE